MLNRNQGGKIMTYRKKLGKSVGTWRASHDTEFL